MKRLALVLAAAAMLGWPAGSAFAQEEGPPKAPKPTREGSTRPKPKKPLLRGEYFIMTKVCDLSEAQQVKIAELVKQRQEAFSQLHEKGKAVKAAMADARKSKDEDARKKAAADMREFEAESRKLAQKWSKEVLDVLTPEQQAKWQEFTVMREVQRRLRGVKFEEDQLDRVKAAYVQHTTGVDLTDEKARRDAVAKLSAHVMKEILTDAQRLDMLTGQVLGRYGRAKLTDEQTAQVKAACAEQLKGLDPSDGKAVGAALKKLSEHINTTILTDQQRESMEPKRKVKQPPQEPKVKPAAQPAPKE